MTQRGVSPKRLICWDMGNVFLPWDIKHFLETIAPYTPFQVAELDSRLMESNIFTKFMTGECRTQFQFFAAYASLMQTTSALTYAIFRNAWDTIFWQNHDIEPLLAKVRPDVRMVIISNADPLMNKHIRAHPAVKRYIPHPRDHFLSHREGVLKPDPEIFKRAFSRTGIPANEAVLVDDIQEHCTAFENLGGAGICWNAHLNSIRELESALATHGVFR